MKRDIPVDEPSFDLDHTPTPPTEPESGEGNRRECRADGEQDPEEE